MAAWASLASWDTLLGSIFKVSIGPLRKTRRTGALQSTHVRSATAAILKLTRHRSVAKKLSAGRRASAFYTSGAISAST